MSHPTPPPYGQQPHQPGHGYPQYRQTQPYQQPYAGGPAPYQPPPPPKKGMNGWAITGITLGGVFVFLIVLGALVGGDDSGTGSSGKPDTRAAAPEKPAAADPKSAEKAKDEPAAQPAPESPVKVTATKTRFAPSILHDGGAYTSVKVTIANNSEEKIDVNPLYFSITATDGSKHTAELGVDEHQIDTVDLAPGEKITGTITGEGAFTPKYVTYTDGLFGDDVRGNVS
ncbi:DUF4352 domain-containing protein [Streptomyces pristinaespiralis]|nr:DUF4352 domain-containing protein [Streptomyces pristinaespiralis]ALC20587.1 NdaS [Streptomyces pristinaespiralis]QMU16574.1 DUF4352 domain-containing protein [Streptomyces pristinaespiralis]